MPVTTGTHLGSYEITGLLGAGGMGEVYRARDARLGRDVALKILAPRLAGDREAVARFEQEARAASALSHPHILHIYDIGTADIAAEPVRFMVMELVDGVTLSKKIHDDAADLREILEWLAQVADGLAKAHAAGIIHRDLKPDNVMVSHDGYAKILDFGLAKLLETRGLGADDDTVAMQAGPTSTPGMIVGTVSYMSPEQAQGKPADARTDVFAFGCMLYEAAAQRRAFEGSSAIDTLHRVIYSEPDLGPLDQRLARIVRRCLAKRADERYQSIRDVAIELRELARDSVARVSAAAVVGAPRVSSGASRERTVAVLPFDDLSPARDNEYFADGLAEEITFDLSKIALLRVISRAAVKKYRGEEKDVARVAADLGAEYVIDGSVRKAGHQLRITAQLIDARTLAQLWSEKYSGTLDDVFDIQESVARSIVEQLKVKITPREDAMLAQRPMANVEAFECYLRARRNILRFDAEGLELAMADIEKGLAIDRGNIQLLYAKAYLYWQSYNAGVNPDPAQLDRAEAIARVILEMDAESPHGHRLLGLVAVQQQQLRRGLDHLQKSLAGDPNDPDTLAWLCFVRPIVGLDTATLVDRYAAVEPHSPLVYPMRGMPLMLSGDFRGAAEQLVHAREAMAIFTFVHLQALALAGEVEQVRALLPDIEERVTDPLFGPLTLALGRIITGDPGGGREALSEEVLRGARADLQYCSWVAEIYAQLGERELALDWLGNAITRGFVVWPFFAKHDRLLDPIRDDPRFDALMERARREWEAISSD